MRAAEGENDEFAGRVDGDEAGDVGPVSVWENSQRERTGGLGGEERSSWLEGEQVMGVEMLVLRGVGRAAVGGCCVLGGRAGGWRRWRGSSGAAGGMVREVHVVRRGERVEERTGVARGFEVGMTAVVTGIKE